MNKHSYLDPSAVEKIPLSYEDSLFSEELFSLVVQWKKKETQSFNETKKIFYKEHNRLSLHLDMTAIQESAAVKNRRKAAKLAQCLITKEGKLDKKKTEEALTWQKETLYSLGPKREQDGVRNEHIVDVLNKLLNNKELRAALYRISKPHINPAADQIIRETLFLEDNHAITNVEARQAALSALLTFLRQSVGSCFATAPAIIVHQEQPIQFLDDISELFSSGRLKRVVDGHEYAVPLSPTWGAADLNKTIFIESSNEKQIQLVSEIPGVIYALQKVDFFEKESSFKEKSTYIKEFLLSLLSVNAEIIMSVETFIQKLLQWHFKIDQKELERFLLYNKRQMSVLPSVMGVRSTHSKGKNSSLSHYFKVLESVKNHFKALTTNPLLKSWEFTLASFAETKTQFAKWNLYASLGLKFEDVGGIGEYLYHILKGKLEQCNAQVEELNIVCEQLYVQVEHQQRRMQRATSEKEAHWLRADYQNKLYAYNTQKELRDMAHFKSRRYANLANDLLTLYDELFPRFFQEIYDADMYEVSVLEYDDSPAGFRLLYKHGRSNTSQWSMIHTPEEYIEYLANFFIATESEVAGSNAMNGLQDDVTEIVTGIVQHVRSDRFLESAYHRMAHAHQGRMIENPLENWEQLDKKPWAYTSGGSLHTLVSCYFRLEGRPLDQERWVESPMELFVFVVDSLKSLTKLAEQLINGQNKRRLLMHSPTHAFLLTPHVKQFYNLWHKEEFTYTWLRDETLLPSQKKINKIRLNRDHMQVLIDELGKDLPSHIKVLYNQAFTHLYGSMSCTSFRLFVLNIIAKDKSLKNRAALSSEAVDALLYNMLPLCANYNIERVIFEIVDHLEELDQEIKERFKKTFKKCERRGGRAAFVSPQYLLNLALSLSAFALGQTSYSSNLALSIVRVMRDLGYMWPEPCIFADTNWEKDFFAFVVNPGNQQLELWRVDALGVTGSPIRAWDQWLNGSVREPKWGIFTRPEEYISATREVQMRLL